MRLNLAAILLLTTIALPTAGQEMRALKSDALVTSDTVRLGDLVSGVGDKASTPLFRAPDIGKIGTIRAESVRAAAADLGLHGIESNGISAITVTRAMPVLDAHRLVSLLRIRLTKLDASLNDSSIDFDNIPPRLAARNESDISIDIPSFDVETGRFRAEITDLTGEKREATGVVQSRILVPVLVRSVGRGDVINAADFVMEPRARRTLPVGTLTEPARLASVVAKRQLRPGLIRGDDITGRDLVERNQKVNVVYSKPGLSLTMAGKALASGPAGALVQVQNLNSKRTFDAVVTGPGTVSAKIY